MRPLGILMAGMLLFACSKDDTGGGPHHRRMLRIVD